MAVHKARAGRIKKKTTHTRSRAQYLHMWNASPSNPIRMWKQFV